MKLTNLAMKIGVLLVFSLEVEKCKLTNLCHEELGLVGFLPGGGVVQAH